MIYLYAVIIDYRHDKYTVYANKKAAHGGDFIAFYKLKEQIYTQIE